MNTLKENLEEFQKETEAIKNCFVEEIFSSVDHKIISKLDAILLLEQYELLPIGETIGDMPQFIHDTFEVDYEGSRARSAVFYFSEELEEERFYEEGEEIDDYTAHPDMTIEEGIDLVYDYVKEHRIIGTKIDW